jgi:hypothetical protein
MASADFCPFSSNVTIRRAASAYGRVRWLIRDFRPGPQSGSRGTLRPPIEQISPDKNMDYRCTTAAFTLSLAPGGLRHLVLTRPGTKPSMRFLSVGSHLCTRASSRQHLAALPLPSASSYTPSYRTGQVLLHPSPFIPLTEAITCQWPEFPYYGGDYDDIEPHVSLAYGDEPNLSELAAGICDLTPVQGRASLIDLSVGQPGYMITRAEFSLRSARFAD